MPVKKKKKKGIWTVFGLTVDLNVVLTTIFGSLACTGIGAGLFYLHTLFVTFNTMEREVPRLVKLIHRLETEYPPLVKPKFEASVINPAPPKQ